MLTAAGSRIAQEFLRYAERDYHGSSPLYDRLSRFIATESLLVEIASHGRSAIPNLFLAAVHLLLVKHGSDPLAAYYPSIKDSAEISEGLEAAFRSFCLRHRDELVSIVSARVVQTNEVSRCAYLFPAFHLVQLVAGGRPLAVIDIGASAGLHLLWDKYSYDYGIGEFLGEMNSPVKIVSTGRGSKTFEFARQRSNIRSRVGIDLNSVSLDDADDVSWLEALIWPEHASRRQLFRRAIDVFKANSGGVTLIEGDAGSVLYQALEEIPYDELLCVYQTHIWRQLSKDTKSKLSETLEKFGKSRPVFFISALTQLKLELYAPSGRRTWTLANYEQHGSWVEWLADELEFKSIDVK